MTAARIVAGFDDTTSGFDAVALGRQLAETTGAELVVAHVYPGTAITAADVAFDPGITDRLLAEAKERLAHAQPALEGFRHWKGVVRESIPAARGLHEVAEAHDAALVVVGSTHRHGLGRVVPGATAEKLLHGSSFAVAVAPAGWREQLRSSIHVVGAGFNGSKESFEALAAAASLAGAAGAELRVIAAFEPPNPANPAFAVTSHGFREFSGQLRGSLVHGLEQVLESLPDGLPTSGEVIDGHAADVLAAQSSGFDLLAVGSRGWGALRSVMIGTRTHELVSRSRCPLLVVPRGAGNPLEALTAGRARAAVH